MIADAAPRTSRAPRPGGRKLGRPLAYAPPGYRARLLATLRRIGDPSEQGWQSAVAERLGVVPHAVSQWASGGRTPSLELLVRIAREAGVNLHWLLVGTGPIAAPETDAGRQHDAGPVS